MSGDPERAPDRDPERASAAERPSFLERVGSAGASVASLEPAHPRLRRALRIGLVLLVAASLAVAIGTQWNRLPTIQWRFEPAWLLLCTLAFLATLVLNAEGWRVIVASLGYPLPRRRSRAIWSASVLARYVPTNALMVLSRISMSAREGVPQRVCLASVVYELALQVSAALAVGSYFVLELEALEGRPLRFLVLVLPAAALAGLHPAVFHRVANFAFARLGREPLALSLRFSRVILIWLLYATVFVLGGIAILSFAAALYPVTGGDLPALVSSWAVGFTVAVLAFVMPAGFGAREVGLVTALAPVLPSTVALAVAVAARILLTLLELVFAAAASIIDGKGLHLLRRLRTETEPAAAASQPAAGQPSGADLDDRA